MVVKIDLSAPRIKAVMAGDSLFFKMNAVTRIVNQLHDLSEKILDNINKVRKEHETQSLRFFKIEQQNKQMIHRLFVNFERL